MPTVSHSSRYLHLLLASYLSFSLLQTRPTHLKHDGEHEPHRHARLRRPVRRRVALAGDLLRSRIHTPAMPRARSLVPLHHAAAVAQAVPALRGDGARAGFEGEE